MFQQILLSYQLIDQALRRNSASVLRMSIGLVYLWFGVLKFFPALSPAEPLAMRTLAVLTLNLVPDHVAIVLLAAFETVIGLLLLFGLFSEVALPLLYAHLAGTALPLLFFRQQLFLHFPYAPSFEAQYIFKNIVILAASLTIKGSWPRRSAKPSLFAGQVGARESRTSIA